MPAGRPSKIFKIDKDQLKILTISGFTEHQIANFFKINKSTLTRWKQKNKEFCTTLKTWKHEADEVVERSLYQRAIGYSHKSEKIFQYEGKIIRTETVEHYPPDPTSMIFWLKNRKKEEWRDKTESELNLNLSVKTILDAVEAAEKADKNRISAHI